MSFNLWNNLGICTIILNCGWGYCGWEGLNNLHSEQWLKMEFGFRPPHSGADAVSHPLTCSPMCCKARCLPGPYSEAKTDYSLCPKPTLYFVVVVVVLIPLFILRFSSAMLHESHVRIYHRPNLNFISCKSPLISQLLMHYMCPPLSPCHKQYVCKMQWSSSVPFLPGSGISSWRGDDVCISPVGTCFETWVSRSKLGCRFCCVVGVWSGAECSSLSNMPCVLFPHL